MAQAVGELRKVALEVGEVEHRCGLNDGMTVSAPLRALAGWLVVGEERGLALRARFYDSAETPGTCRDGRHR
jgi:hypothetical protein